MSLFEELKRRNVLRVALLYIAASWLILQVGEILFEILEVPMWGMRLVLGLLIIGFPIALIFSWVYEITPEGIKRETEISHELQLATTKKLDVAVIAVVVLAIGLFSAKWFLEGEEAPTGAVATQEIIETADQRARATVAAASVAVLPFVNMSGDQEDEYFADGLSEELLNRLAQLPELLVAGRTSSFAFKGQNQDLREIGQALGVSNILEGSVRRSNDHVRVTAQLVRVDDGFHLWSETYDHTLENTFEVQDEIAESVARTLDVLLDEDKRESMRVVGVRNVEAFVAYQRAFELYELAHGEMELLPTLKQAVEILDEAIHHVPDFGAAYFVQSDYYAHIMYSFDTTPEEKAAALVEYMRVLDAARENIPDSQRRAFIDVDMTLYSDNWRQLEKRIRRAIAEPGCNKPIWLETATAFGYAEGVRDVYGRAWECDPLSMLAVYQLSFAMMWLGKGEQSLAVLDQAFDRVGNTDWGNALRAKGLMVLGRLDEARAEGARIPPETTFFGDTPILIEAVSGDLDKARAMIASWPSHRDDVEPLDIEVFAATGDRETANAMAAEMDALPGGPARLANLAVGCLCGAPFDIEVTPNFRARLEESGLPWPPPSRIKFPAKDW